MKASNPDMPIKQEILQSFDLKKTIVNRTQEIALQINKVFNEYKIVVNISLLFNKNQIFLLNTHK